MSTVTGAASQLAGVAPGDERAGAGLGKSVLAWRLVFEREQLAALARFHSVTAVGEGGQNAGSAASGQSGRAVANGTGAFPATALHADVQAVKHIGAASARPGRGANLGTRVTSPMSPDETCARSFAGQTPVRAPAARALPVPHASAAVANAVLAPAAEWPWRKLHCIVDAEGVHVWLRDASLKPEDEMLLAWIAGLRQALAQSGAKLASITLNGIAITSVA